MHRWIFVIVALAAVAVASLAGCASAATSPSGAPGEVVVYTSVDQVFAEPVFKAFEAKTGVKVRAVYDAEAAKTTGLVNRLVAETSRPRADVWWSGEIVQTLRLAKQGVLAPYSSPSASVIPANLRDPNGMWTGFGGRARVLLYNTASKSPVPASLGDLARPMPGSDVRRIGMSNPVFGTASTQAAILYAAWSPEQARAYYQAIARSGVRVLEGNGDVRDKVVTGELDWGLIDTDDALGAIEKGAPVRVIVPDQDGVGDFGGALVTPNTVGLVAKGPNAANGRLLVDYLLDAKTEQLLVRESWIQFPVRGAPDPRFGAVGITLAPVDWTAAFGMLDRSAADMKDIFLR
jgi:iron(III) transport system substrate-binding protein